MVILGRGGTKGGDVRTAIAPGEVAGIFDLHAKVVALAWLEVIEIGTCRFAAVGVGVFVQDIPRKGWWIDEEREVDGTVGHPGNAFHNGREVFI